MNKEKILFKLRNYFNLLSFDELSEILNDDVLSIKGNKDHLNIRFSGDRNLIVWNDGSKYWHLNNLYHRENNKPAVIHADGSKEWYVNGYKRKTQ